MINPSLRINNIKLNAMKKLFICLLVFFLSNWALRAQDTSRYRMMPNKLILKKALIVRLDSVVEFIPSTVGTYCPKKLLGGDREFGGHGPEIWASIKLRITGRQIVADVYMHARETQSDWSETEGTWHKIIYTAPAGYTISQILTGKESSVHYTSKPGMGPFSPGALRNLVEGARGEELPAKDDGLVTRWVIVGDTMGDDISTDDDPHDDTSVTVQLNPVKVKLHPVAKR
jgi:hypothetical protein